MEEYIKVAGTEWAAPSETEIAACQVRLTTKHASTHYFHDQRETTDQKFNMHPKRHEFRSYLAARTNDDLHNAI